MRHSLRLRLPGIGEVFHDDEQPVRLRPDKLTRARPREFALRFGFGALVAAIAAAVSMAAGPKVGGLFLAFPAILPATLTLVEKKEGVERAEADASGGILGAIGLAAFAGTVLVLMSRIGSLALAIALAVWVVVSVALYVAVRTRILGH